MTSSAADLAPKANPWESVDLSATSHLLTSTIHREPYAAISPSRPEVSQAGRTILVAGGSTGIGFSIAESFAAAGAARVIITGRRQDALDAASTKIKEQFPQAEAIGLINDYGDESAAEKLWTGLRKDGIFVDVLVLNATKMWLPNTLLGLGSETVKDGFKFNVITPYIWTGWLYKQREVDPSRKLFLVNLSSGVIHVPHIGGPVPLYTLTKSSLTMMMQTIAQSIPANELQIVSIDPGMHYTESFQRFVEKDAMPWDDIKLPGDFSVWIASDEAEFLHGRFVWAKWDVEELKAGALRDRIDSDFGFIKVGVKGL
ncbi:hypothetical protein ACJ41O_006385 [Fusarium nematophilum]